MRDSDRSSNYHRYGHKSSRSRDRDAHRTRDRDRDRSSRDERHSRDRSSRDKDGGSRRERSSRDERSNRDRSREKERISRRERSSRDKDRGTRTDRISRDRESTSRDDDYYSRRYKSKSKRSKHSRKSKHRHRSSSSSSTSSSYHSRSSYNSQMSEHSTRRNSKTRASSSEVTFQGTKILSNPITAKEIDLMDSKVQKALETIEEDTFAPKTFFTTRDREAPEKPTTGDKVIIDLNAETVTFPKHTEVNSNPAKDDLFHPNFLGDSEQRQDKWIRKLYLYRQRYMAG